MVDLALRGSTALMALIKTDAIHINSQNITDTTEKMINFLREEWLPMRRSPTASREPLAFLLRQLVTYANFGARLLSTGLTEMIVECLEPIPFAALPLAYATAVLESAKFLNAMPFSKIDPVCIGELRMFFRNLPPSVERAILPEECPILASFQKKLQDYDPTTPRRPFYSDAEIRGVYALTGGPIYKQAYQRHFRIRKQQDGWFTTFVKRVREMSGVLPYGEQTGLARVLGTKESNIRYWKGKVLENALWRPWQNDRGEAKRLFSDEVEAEVAKYIRETYFEKNLLFCNDDFKPIMFDLWCEDKDNWLEMDTFKCSPGFITDFKKRNHMSSRALHYKRRSEASLETRLEWVNRIQKLLREEDKEYIINMDETHWQTFPNGIMTWRTTGSDSVQVRMNGNEKQGLTVLASITATGRKLPLLILAKGKTTRCENTQIPADIGNNFKFHSPSGWSTKEVMQHYLQLLRDQYPPAAPGAQAPRLHLIFDMYSSHRDAEVRELASRLNIEVYFIPPGLTDEFQPLDRRVFGCLKAGGKAAFRVLYRKDPGQKFTTQSAVSCLVKAWTHLSDKVISDAWDIYSDE